MRQRARDEGFEIPSWEQIYRLLLNLARKIRRDGFLVDIIVGVSRGGWTPERVLSDLLENPRIANVKAEFYVGVAETKGAPVITQTVSVDVKDKSVLVVDDVSDTGRSLQLVKQHLLEEAAKTVKIATLYLKPWSITVPDYYEKTTRDWIIFPWERKETVRNIIKRYKSEGKTVEEVKEKLVGSGLDSRLVERFVREILEG